MSNAPAAAPPAVTLVEKAAMLGATVAVAALLVIPVTREAVFAAPIAVAHWVADTAVNVWQTLGNLVGLN